MERKLEECSYPAERPPYCQSCKAGCTRDPETCRVKKAADRRGKGGNGCALFAMGMIGIVMLFTGEVFCACSISMDNDQVFAGASIFSLVLGLCMLVVPVTTAVMNRLGRQHIF